MNSLQNIEAFIAHQKFAVIGVSENKRKFGYTIFHELKKRGYEIEAVNRNLAQFGGQKCYNSVNELPEEIRAAILVTKQHETLQLIEDCIQKGIKNIWIQQGGEPEKIETICSKYDANIVYNRCILMFAKPTGFHKFHGNLNKLFGKWPK